MKLSKKILGGALLFIVALIFFLQIPKDFNLSWYLPYFYSIVTMVLSGLLILSGLLGWKKDDKDKFFVDVEALKASKIAKTIAFMAMLLVYYIAISYVGMVVSTALFIIAMYLFLGVKDIKTIAVGLVVFAAVYCIFAFGLRVRFPHGFLY